MKKLLLFLPLLLCPILSGCNSSNTEITQLTYGTLIEESIIELSPQEFQTKVSYHENFLMTIYPDNSSCSCWDNFKRYLNQVMKDTTYKIYSYPVSKVEGNQTMKDMGGFYELLNSPSFYVVKDDKVAFSAKYNSNNPLFQSKDGFLSEIKKITRAPKLIEVNREQLDMKIAEAHATIGFVQANCPDCNYVIPNTLIPYFETHDFTENIYIFDIEPFIGQPEYAEIKRDYYLSDELNPQLGFDRGYVPTFQYYENGQLKDADVYVNDRALTYDETKQCYHALLTYFTEERLQYLHYLDDVEIKDLSKIDIPEGDTFEKLDGSHGWKNEAAAIYHDPIVLAFISTYLK